MSLVTIIIPAYKNPEQLKKCTDAIDKQPEVDQKTFVWNNDEENIGFTAAVNKGLREAIKDGSKYAIILNQDCYLEKDAIVNMVSFMDKKPKCAIAGIKQLSDKNKDQIIHGGCLSAFPAGLHIAGLVSNKACTENKQMPWVNGACMIARVDAIMDFGLMDENYFLLCSDSDWCYAARARNWEVWYIANAVCVHEQGISMKPTKEFESISLKDVLYFRDKWTCDGLFRELSKEIFD